MKHLEAFDYLSKLFSIHGFEFFIIGGTSRDLLLNHDIADYDFVTTATPNEIAGFLEPLDMTYSIYGSVKYIYNGIKIDITTLRKEGAYDDSRHPSYIEFVKDISVDCLRRDFTINSIYIDKNYDIIDPFNGVEDIKNKAIRMIGDPEIRLKEDPLRIIRAYRFAITYDFEIEENLKNCIVNNIKLLSNISNGKLMEEFKKINI